VTFYKRFFTEMNAKRLLLLGIIVFSTLVGCSKADNSKEGTQTPQPDRTLPATAPSETPSQDDNAADSQEPTVTDFQPFVLGNKVASLNPGEFDIAVNPAVFGRAELPEWQTRPGVLVRGDIADKGEIWMVAVASLGEDVKNLSESRRNEEVVRRMRINSFTAGEYQQDTIAPGEHYQPASEFGEGTTYPMYSYKGHTQDGDCISQLTIFAGSRIVDVAKVTKGTTDLSCSISNVDDYLVIGGESK
jgi:hypothetical protein